MSRKVNIFPTNNNIITDTLYITGIIYGAELEDNEIIECLQKRAKIFQIFEDGTEIQLFLSNLKEDIYDQAQKEKEEAEKLKQEYAIFKEKEKAYLATIEKLEKDLADCDVEGMEALRKEKEAAEAKVTELQGNISDLEDQITAKEQDIADKEATISTLNTTITSKNEEIRGLNVTLSEKEAAITTKDETIANVSAQLATATANLGTVTGELNNTKTELAETKDTLTKTQEELDTTKSNLTEAQNLNNTLSASLDTVTKESEAKDVVISEKDATIKSLNESVTEKDATITKKQEKVDQLTSELETVNTEKTTIQTELTNLQVEHIDLIENSFTIVKESDIITDFTDKTLTNMDGEAVTIEDAEKVNTYPGITVAVANNTVTFDGEIDADVPGTLKYLLKVKAGANRVSDATLVKDETDKFLLLTLDTSKALEVNSYELRDTDSEVSENVLIMVESKITKKVTEA